MRENRLKKFTLPIVLVVLILLGIFTVKLIRGYANKYHESQNENNVITSENAPEDAQLPATQMKLVCKEDDEIVERLKLPAGAQAIKQELQVYPNYDDTILVEEGYLKPNTEKDVAIRYLISDVTGRLYNSFYNLQAPPIVDDNKNAVHTILDKRGNKKSYIADTHGNRKTEVYDNIDKLGNFYKAELITYDNYGPLFVETTIYNKSLRKIFHYNDNREKPTNIKLICNDSALLVDDNGVYLAVNENGLKINLDNTVKNYSDAFDCIYFKVPWNTGFKDTYRVYNINTGKYYDLSLSDETNSVDIYAFNFYKKSGTAGEAFVYNGTPLDSKGMIEKVSKITQTSPQLVFIAQLSEPEKVQYQTYNYAVFTIAGGSIKQISQVYTDIVSGNDNIYKPLKNTFYLKKKRENASGGYYHMLRNDGKLILDDSKRIVDITNDSFVVKEEEKPQKVQDNAPEVVEEPQEYAAYLDSKTLELVSKDKLISRIYRNLAGWENWIVPEKPKEEDTKNEDSPEETQENSDNNKKKK